jgi:hypothetical protein
MAFQRGAPRDVSMKMKQPSVAAKIFTLARWRYLKGDTGISKQHQEGRDLVLDAIVAVGFWLLVALLFCWLYC